MARSLITTEAILKQICSSTQWEIWKNMVEKQNNIVVSTINSDDKLDESDTLWTDYRNALHRKQIKILPASNIVNNLSKQKEYFSALEDSIFLLNISDKDAQEISRDYGVCCLSIENANSPYITHEGWEINTNDKKQERSWDCFYKGVNRNNTSALVIDRYMFCPEGDPRNGCPTEHMDDCLFNLKAIIDNILPSEINENKFVLTLVFSHQGSVKDVKKDSNSKPIKDKKGHLIYEYHTFEEIVKMIDDIKKEIYRPYTYDVEAFSISKTCSYYNDTHDRYIITNYFVTNATQKLVAFTHDKQPLHKQKIYFNYIYSKGLTGRSSLPIVDKETMIEAIKNLISESPCDSMRYAINGEILPVTRDMKVKNKLLK